ncbi:MAG: DUF1667 domain-containing protein [Clostridia bacterium]|nr:DUF1667 domain-containing protein [Clostridia bacterium]
MEKTFTCIECPLGCTITAKREKDELLISGNTCPKGKAYVEAEMTEPKRILTTTVKLKNGNMLPVKTDKAIKKENLFLAMKKISLLCFSSPIKIGDILVENFLDGANLIATDNAF